jgi:large subunit ribosomal protein L24
MRKIRKGDQVVVLSGRNKHQRPNPQVNRQGGIVEKEMPLPVSKVAIWNPAAKRGDRIGIKTLADGKRVRFFKSSGEMLDV